LGDTGCHIIHINIWYFKGLILKKFLLKKKINIFLIIDLKNLLFIHDHKLYFLKPCHHIIYFIIHFLLFHFKIFTSPVFDLLLFYQIVLWDYIITTSICWYFCYWIAARWLGSMSYLQEKLKRTKTYSKRRGFKQRIHSIQQRFIVFFIIPPWRRSWITSTNWRPLLQTATCQLVKNGTTSPTRRREVESSKFKCC